MRRSCYHLPVKFMEVEANLPLGLFGGFPYTGQECTIERGTSLFLYTDGVTEAENANKELYTDERLLQQLGAMRKDDTHTVIEDLLKDIEEHVNESEQSDDITVMYFIYK